MSTAPILITGVSRRIGHHCALRLRELGYAVLGTHHGQDPALDTLRAQGVELIEADLASTVGIQDFIARLLAQVTALRGIVHNASVWEADPENNAAAHFEHMMSLHALAPYLINRACEPLLQAVPQADIVHISDDRVRTGSASRIAYSASKAALENLTLSFARHLAPRVKVNGIAPALILFNPGDTAEYRQAALSKALLPIEPGPEVVFQSLLYLLENPYVTGITLPLNGGRHAQ